MNAIEEFEKEIEFLIELYIVNEKDRDSLRGLLRQLTLIEIKSRNKYLRNKKKSGRPIRI